MSTILLPKPVSNTNGKTPLSKAERDTWDFSRLKAEMNRLQSASVGRYEANPDEAYIRMVRQAAYDAEVSIGRAQELLKQFFPDDPLLDRLIPQKAITRPKAPRKAKTTQAFPTSNAEPYPHIAPGEYLLRCVEAKSYRDPQFRRHVCRLAFSSTNIHDGAVIYGFLNLANRDEPAAGRRSRYWKAWVKANGGKPPVHGQPMLPSIFEGLWCKVLVSEVVIDSDKKEHAAGAVYSTVSEILEASRA
jgi:hypothetical protein